MAATISALVSLWPDGEPIESSAAGIVGRTLAAEVTEVAPDACKTVPLDTPTGVTRCQRVTVELDEGNQRGQLTSFDLIGPVSISSGDHVRVTPLDLPPDAQVGGVPADRYAFADFERRLPLAVLAGVFATLVLVSARWRGLRALIGLGVSLVVVVAFVVPAILEGSDPVGVATAGSLAIMLVTVILGHGVGPKAIAALIGTAAALLLTLVLANAAVDAIHITGLASEDVTFLQATAQDLSVRGLLLAGMVIAALGVLDDLTVSQSSTVLALRHANPSLPPRELFRRAMSVGHDHIVATVNTLVLAYAGASLPVLLIFSLADTSFGTAVNSEVVASQIVATLVGSIGLIAAVPITTGLAALLASGLDPADLEDAAHVH
jgi:uncharacterized membrane protein